MPFEAPNKNLLWTRLIVEELVRSGVDAFYIAPGSRSTPLVSAVAGHPAVRAFVHFDERGTAFRALGYARATGKPAVWITTSGSALANGLPAVVEAFQEQIPMILLTADRPPELRESGANQTIRQPGMFGSYTVWSFDLPCPDPRIDAAFVLATVDQAVHRSRKGPVHVNCMFREPLAPTAEAFDRPEPGPGIRRWLEQETPFTTYSVADSDPAAAASDVADAIRSSSRPVLVAGRMSAPDRNDIDPIGLAAAISSAMMIPVFPDVCSGMRFGAVLGPPGLDLPEQVSPTPGGLVSGSTSADWDRRPLVVTHYDALLHSGRVRNALRPDLIVQFGSTPVSSRCLRWIRESDARLIVVSDAGGRMDPEHAASLRLDAAPLDVLGVLAGMESESSESRQLWCGQWDGQASIARAWQEAHFRDPARLTEQVAAFLLSETLSAKDQLVLGNSLPVRHMDTSGSARSQAFRVSCNRGASGIDGTIATAAGLSDARSGRTVVFLGDLALLHDLNSLSMAREQGLVVVVVNNDGGGIFSYLPVREHGGMFERFFATPHGYGFADAASMFSLHFEKPDSTTDYIRCLRQALERKSGSLIEIRTDRNENLVEQKRLLDDLDARTEQMAP